MKPRKPNKEELRQFATYLYDYARQKHRVEYDVESVQDMVKQCAYIAILDDYATDIPCYDGKLMLVVWDSCPGDYELLIWKNEGIISVGQHIDENTREQLFIKGQVCELCRLSPTWKGWIR